MRLMLILRAEQDQKDVSTEYNKMQGFVYSQLLEAGLGGIHDRDGYKVFSFSNIFPYGDAKEGDIRKMIIASPSKMVIERLKDVFSEKVGNIFNIGDCLFSLQRIQSFGLKVGTPLKVVCATPIMLRIPEKMYDTYQIPEEERRSRYVYWRPQIAFEAFIKQLSENLIKKYNDFYGTEISHPSLFEQFFFKRPVHTRIIIDGGKSYGVAASMWEFRWSHMDDVQKKIITFGLDAGFGERNSYGFGFVNEVGEKRVSDNR